MINIAVLISGNGSNLQAIIDAIENKKLDAKIACVISSNHEAFGLTRALKSGIPTAVFSKKDIPFQKVKSEKQLNMIDKAILDYLQRFDIDLCVLAGYMRLLSPNFISHHPGRILNIHPSLLPKYPGLHTHEQVILNGDTEHGCTIHIVTQELDDGPILAQARMKVEPNDTVESIKTRIHQLEHELYPATLQMFSQTLKQS